MRKIRVSDDSAMKGTLRATIAHHCLAAFRVAQPGTAYELFFGSGSPTVGMRFVTALMRGEPAPFRLGPPLTSLESGLFLSLGTLGIALYEPTRLVMRRLRNGAKLAGAKRASASWDPCWCYLGGRGSARHTLFRYVGLLLRKRRL